MSTSAHNTTLFVHAYKLGYNGLPGGWRMHISKWLAVLSPILLHLHKNTSKDILWLCGTANAPWEKAVKVAAMQSLENHQQRSHHLPIASTAWSFFRRSWMWGILRAEEEPSSRILSAWVILHKCFPCTQNPGEGRQNFVSFRSYWSLKLGLRKNIPNRGTSIPLCSRAFTHHHAYEHWTITINFPIPLSRLKHLATTIYFREALSTINYQNVKLLWHLFSSINYWRMSTHLKKHSQKLSTPVMVIFKKP